MAVVLYIEDDLFNRILIRRILSAEGHDVLEAGNADEALAVLFERAPDLILMDINMPEVDGFTLTRQIKANPTWRHVPVVALTANVMKGDRERVLQAGCDGYIQKPVDVDALPRQIAAFLSPDLVERGEQ